MNFTVHYQVGSNFRSKVFDYSRYDFSWKDNAVIVKDTQDDRPVAYYSMMTAPYVEVNG